MRASFTREDLWTFLDLLVDHGLSFTFTACTAVNFFEVVKNPLLDHMRESGLRFSHFSTQVPRAGRSRTATATLPMLDTVEVCRAVQVKSRGQGAQLVTYRESHAKSRDFTLQKYIKSSSSKLLDYAPDGSHDTKIVILRESGVRSCTYVLRNVYRTSIGSCMRAFASPFRRARQSAINFIRR